MGPLSIPWPIVGGVVILGVGLVWFMRETDKTYTKPILKLTVPAFGQGAQASTVDNLTQSILHTSAVIQARRPVNT